MFVSEIKRVKKMLVQPSATQLQAVVVVSACERKV
jgi:hypothetical protein